MAKRRHKKTSNGHKKSRAGLNKDRNLVQTNTVNLMIQVVALMRIFIDFLGL